MKSFKNKYLDSIDWEKFLERDMELFIADLFALLYNKPLKNETGFGHKHLLVYYKNGIGTWYLSKKESKNCEEHFSELIKKQDPRIDKWLKEEKETHKLMKIISSKDNIEKLIKNCSQIMLYNTEIPFRLLVPLERMKGFNELRKNLEQIRLKAFWPQIMENIFQKIYLNLSKNKSITAKQASLLRPEELIDYLKNNKLISIEELDKRDKGCYFYYHNNKINFIFSEKDILEEDFSEKNDCKGRVAFKGIVKGKARIINSIKQMKEFKKGEILISINTNPSIMTAIQKASAIVSDEGGITSHAAIVSRELKIPCIVGSKYATKIFKDGDLVEVDAEKGIVRKL